MSKCITKSEGSPVDNNDDVTIVEANGLDTNNCNDEGPRSQTFCVLCYEPYEDIILNSSQAERIFRVICKCLRVRSAKTAFALSRGSDFPLCESCSEFAVDLLKLHNKLKAIRETIEEKTEEIIEIIIESELARKERILNIRDIPLKDIKHDRRVDSFRKQVIQSCEQLASSFTEAEAEGKCLEYDGGFEEDHPYTDALNFKIKKKIFEPNSTCETVTPLLDLTGDSDDNSDKETIKASLVTHFDISDGSDGTSVLEPISDITGLKETYVNDIFPSKIIEVCVNQPRDVDIKDVSPSKKIKINQPRELIINKVIPSKKMQIKYIDQSRELDHKYFIPSKQIEINDEEALLENKEQNSNCDEKSIAKTTTINIDDFITLNYENPVVFPGLTLESNEDSNETTIFKVVSPFTLPKVSFEQILKKSPSDNEEDFEIIERTQVLGDECDEIENRGTEENNARESEESPYKKTLKKTRFSWGKCEYSDGNAVFQNVEVKLLNKEKSLVQCTLCKLVTRNSKGRKAMMKMRTHIVATHCGGVYQCSICKTKCNDNSHLLIHMQGHEKHNSGPKQNFVCQICSHICISQSGLKTHVTRKHKEPADESTFNIISLSVLNDTISMVQVPTTTAGNIENPLITKKRKRSRPAKYLHEPGQQSKPPKWSIASSKSTKRLNKSKSVEILQCLEKSTKRPQVSRKESITKSSGSEKSVATLLDPRKSTKKRSRLRKSIQKLSGSGKPVKRPSELVQSTESLTETGQPIKKRRGPWHHRKSDLVDDSNKSVNISDINSPTIFTKSSNMDESNVNARKIIKYIGSSSEIVKRKHAVVRPRKTTLPQAMIPRSDIYTDGKSDSVTLSNVSHQAPKSPTYYIALNFNADSHSEERDSDFDKYINVQASQIADPLFDEEVHRGAPKISRKRVLTCKAIDNLMLAVNEPENIDIDLTESDSKIKDENDIEDEQMPIVTSTISLASNPLLQKQLLVNPVITSQSASSFQSSKNNSPPL